MKMRLAFAAFALLAGVVPARASIVDISFIGTQTGGAADIPGLFGPPNSNLAPGAFSITFRFDLSKGTTFPVSGGGTDVIGGTSFGTSSPSLGWSVTIDGKTVQVPDGSASAQLQTAAGTPSLLDVAAFGPSATPGKTNGALFDFSSLDGALPATLNANYDYLVKPDTPAAPGDSFSAGPSFIIWTASGSATGLNAGQISISEIKFTVEAPGATPGTGLSGLVGLAALGVGARRRRRGTA